MTKRKDMPYLNHVLDAINDIGAFMKNISKESFFKNKEKQNAVIRSIEVIGEAVKNVSNEMREKYSETEWTKIAGTRDRVIHKYFGVNLDIVWNIIKKDLPDLKQQIAKIKEDLEKSKEEK